MIPIVRTVLKDSTLILEHVQVYLPEICLNKKLYAPLSNMRRVEGFISSSHTNKTLCFQHAALTVVYVTVKQIARTVSKDSTLTLEHVQVSLT